MSHTVPGMLKNIYENTFAYPPDAAEVDWEDMLCGVGKDNGTR